MTILTRGPDNYPAVATLPNGNTVVVWQSDDVHSDVSPTGGYIPGSLKAQLFDIDGNKIGVEGQLTDVGGAGAHSWPIVVSQF